MKIRQINLDDEELPESLTVQMSVAEAAFVAKVVGGMRGKDQDEMVRDGSALGSEIYRAFTGSFFNRFWEAGIDDVLDKMQPPTT